MAEKGVVTRAKEMQALQEELAKVQNKMVQMEARLEGKLEARLQASEEKNCKEMKALFEHFLGGSSLTVSRGKEIMGALPSSFTPKETMDPPPTTTGQTSRALCPIDHFYRLECPRFDGTDFCRRWSKLEQFFAVEGVLEMDRVHTVMLHLEGRPLD